MAEGLMARLAALAADHPGLSGVRLVDDGGEALALRLRLVAAAQRCIDVQYYIWKDDASGRALLAALAAAAARGVEVRLLLDDHGTAGLDGALAALDALPGVEVRLFNAFRWRSPKWLNFLWDFGRLNRRMHNKCLVVDGVAAVIGGRNIGDEYFVADHPALTADLDVLGVGAVAAEVDDDFELYWASPASVPVSVLVGRAGRVPEVSLPDLDDWWPEADDFDWVPVRMISDDPAKISGEAAPAALWLPQLQDAMGPIRSRLMLVSAYFVPTDAGVALFERLVADGVAVQILTNSLRSNDVAVSHAGYAPVRRRLLAAGVRLWEMKGRAADRAELGLVPRRLRRGETRTKGESTAFFRSGASALHAKTFVADGERLFVGSMNFDPRSYLLNTEIGFLIESPAMARLLEDRLTAMLPAFAWEVKQAPSGRLQWHGRTAVHDREPFTRWWQRWVLTLIGWLPVAWLL
ncbi:MAG: phospholipase D family protein [Polymorphobacter sp.]|uniref:phospholipase D family protein n=1 Tax=Polymorphobacter sp. TaxID=1909290 RepID=UPI003A83B5C1